MPMLRTRHFGTHYDLGIISCFMCTCLIEWKCAGWMSEYWVNASSLRSAWSRAYVWKYIVRESFPRYDDDMALEWRIQL